VPTNEPPRNTPSGAATRQPSGSFILDSESLVIPIKRRACPELAEGNLALQGRIVIPTGADHRKAMICGVEGPAVHLFGFCHSDQREDLQFPRTTTEGVP